MTHPMLEQKLDKILSEIKLTNSENELIRISYTYVEELTSNIKNGNYQAISIAPYFDWEKNTGATTTDRTKKYEYYTVAFIFNAANAAIAGGLKEGDAFDISDAMLKILSNCSSIEEMHDVAVTSMRVLAYKVFLSKNGRNSVKVEQCKTYIAQHIFKKITLNEIAASIGATPNYLSRLFVSETGYTIHKYILKEKMNIACNMLKYSDYPVSDIANYLSFASQSNFAEIFKKWVGITPTQYRKENFVPSF